MELVDSIATGYAGPVGGQGGSAPTGTIPPAGVPDGLVHDGDGMLRSNEGDHTVWRVQCGDLINRGRCVTVYVDEGEVVVACPPGETARMSAEQVSRLQVALSEATRLAERYR